MRTILRKVGAVAALAVLSATSAIEATPAGAWPAPTRLGGVTGVRVNGSGGGDGLSYLGAYAIDPVGKNAQLAVCVMWEGTAPNPADGAYAQVSTTSDPILSNVVAQITSMTIGTTNETNLAAAAAVAKYRSNQLGLPGATIYGPPGGPDPTGPASFLLSDGSPPPTEYNSGAATSANTVATAAWQLWNAALLRGIDWVPSIALGAHPGISGETMSATITILKQDGTPVPEGIDVGAVTATNGSGVTLSSQLTNSSGQVTVTWTVTNGSAPSGITVSTQSPDDAIVYRPTLDASEQTMVATNYFQTQTRSALAPAPTGTVLIQKVNNQTGDLVPGATLELRHDANHDGTYETKVNEYTSGTSAIAINNRPLGNYQLIETAPPAGFQLDSTPATGALTSGGTLTLTARNNEFGKIKIEKRSAQTGELVPGATLRLRYDGDGDDTFETTVGTYTSGTSPITVSNRAAGSYELTETVAPDGYDINNTPVTGNLSWGGTLTVTVRNNELGDIRVQKIDGVNGDPVEGALLRLTGPAPATTTVWEGRSETSPITVPDLRAGVYTLTELEAPEGYHAVSEPSTTTLAWGDTATISLDNFLIIGGSTTASESIATTDGSITEIYDTVTLTGVHADQTVSVTAVLYASESADGPLAVDLADEICTSENELQRITVDVTGPGPHIVGPFRAPEDGFRGVTTFADGVTGAGPQSWLDHCGQADETIEWVTPIGGETLAMDIDPADNPEDDDLGTEVVSAAGTQVWDSVNIDGLATGETATITAALYSDPEAAFPFTEPVGADTCVEDNQIGETITITVTGANDAGTADVFHVGPFSIPEGMQGRVTFADTISSTVTSEDDEPRVEERDWADTCGTPAETLTVRRPVTASTTASVTTTIDGEPIDDPITSDDQLFLWDSVVTNLNAGETGTLTATAYGYFPVADTIGADDCVSGMMMQTFTLTVTGPGPHLVGPVRTDANATGQVTWKDGLVADEGEDPREWTDSCGKPSETKTVRRPIKAITTASHSEVVNTGDIQLWDEITVDGLADGETAEVEANLYGPYTERPGGDSCVKGKLLATFKATVTGPGPHRVGPYKVPAGMTGYVTWQDGVKTTDGRSTLHGCGLLSETTHIVAPTKAAGASAANPAAGSRLATTGTGVAVVLIAGAGLLVTGGVVLTLVRLRRRKVA